VQARVKQVVKKGPCREPLRQHGRFLSMTSTAEAAKNTVATFTDASLRATSVKGAVSAGAAIFGFVVASAPKRPLDPESIEDSTTGCGFGCAASGALMSASTGAGNAVAGASNPYNSRVGQGQLQEKRQPEEVEC
jgi:hypothetical protein